MSIQCDRVTLSEPGDRVLPDGFAIVIPAYNEGRHLEALLAACRAVRPRVVVVVDDGSTDDTSEVLARCAVPAGDGVEVVALRNEPNLGKQGAIRRGLRWLATRDLGGVALIDGDLQHDPAELPALAALLGAFDAVIGARSHAEMPAQRRFANAFVNSGFRLASGVDFVDVQSGLRLYRKPLADALAERLREKGRYGVEHESLTVLAAWARDTRRTLRFAAAPISCAYAGEESKVGVRDILQLAMETFRQGRRLRRALTDELPAPAPEGLVPGAP